jgi:hypothetical protein
MTQGGVLSQTTNASSGAIYYNFTAQTFPVAFSAVVGCVANDNYTGVGAYAGAYTITTSGFTGKVQALTNGAAVPYTWISDGTF